VTLLFMLHSLERLILIMKYALQLLFVILPMLSFCQYFGLSDVKDSIIKNNLVYKYIEYDADDSISFFQTKPNGYYGVFNRGGQIIEKNAFSGGDIVEEFFIHFIYDDKGRNIMLLWYEPNAINKITRIRIEEFDSLGNNYAYKDFSGTEKYAGAYEAHNYGKTDNPISPEITDSVLKKSKKTYYSFTSPEKTDTLEIKQMYFSKDQLDSIYTIYNRKYYPSKTKQKLSYFKSAKIKTYTYSAFDAKGEIDKSYKTIFLENGLPVEKWYIYYSNGKEYVTHTKFTYEYYKSKP